MLPINEVFETIQGEAYYTGTPAVFVRLQGCDVGCPWCDTKHTWEVNAADAADLDHVLAKTGDSPAYANVTVDQLMEVIGRFRARHVVITGGEPCDYDLTELTAKVIGDGRRSVQIETSGTAQVRAADWSFVTVSPKVDMPGGRALVDATLARADEIKMPVGKPADIDRLRVVLDRSRAARAHRNLTGAPHVWLQPLSQSEKATALCVEAATANGWRLSLQTHKYLGVR